MAQVRQSYSSLIHQERSNSWCRLFLKAESAKEVSTLVQKVGNDKVRGVSLLRQGDTFTMSAKESLDFLLKQHFPMHLPPREEQEMEDVHNFINSNRSEEILQYFQFWRIRAAAASFQPIKAAGPDDLKPIVLHAAQWGEGAGCYYQLIQEFNDVVFYPKEVASNESTLHPEDGEG